MVETARRLSALDIDVLKAEFPLSGEEAEESKWLAACQEISAASHVPWILLSAAVNFEVFLRQVTVACNAGASGIAVGRAVWQEAVTMSADERIQFLQTTGRQRISRLTSLCQALAKPYLDSYQAEAPFDWYKIY